MTDHQRATSDLDHVAKNKLDDTSFDAGANVNSGGENLGHDNDESLQE